MGHRIVDTRGPIVRTKVGKLLEISGGLAAGAEGLVTGSAEPASSQGNSSGPPRTRTALEERGSAAAVSVVERGESMAYGQAGVRGESDEHGPVVVSGSTVANVLRALLFEAKAAGVSSGCDAVMTAQALLADLEPK